MDGSIHLWFGVKKVCLHLTVDKATNVAVGGYFDYQETLNGYYSVLLIYYLNMEFLISFLLIIELYSIIYH